MSALSDFANTAMLIDQNLNEIAVRAPRNAGARVSARSSWSEWGGEPGAACGQGQSIGATRGQGAGARGGMGRSPVNGAAFSHRLALALPSRQAPTREDREAVLALPLTSRCQTNTRRRLWTLTQTATGR